MNTINEIALMKGARDFDSGALAEIYDSYSPAIFTYAMRLLGDNAMAEDCVSETFSRFLKALRAGNGPQDHLKAYLYRIAHNWITDCYRRDPPPPFELNEEFKADDLTVPEAQVTRRMEQEKVRSALRLLTPDQRQVIMLRFFEEWEIQAVASAMQKPAGAIKALQHRGLEALRSLLGTKNASGEKEELYEPE